MQEEQVSQVYLAAVITETLRGSHSTLVENHRVKRYGYHSPNVDKLIIPANEYPPVDFSS